MIPLSPRDGHVSPTFLPMFYFSFKSTAHYFVFPLHVPKSTTSTRALKHTAIRHQPTTTHKAGGALPALVSGVSIGPPEAHVRFVHRSFQALSVLLSQFFSMQSRVRCALVPFSEFSSIHHKCFYYRANSHPAFWLSFLSPLSTFLPRISRPGCAWSASEEWTGISKHSNAIPAGALDYLDDLSGFPVT